MVKINFIPEGSRIDNTLIFIFTILRLTKTKKNLHVKHYEFVLEKNIHKVILFSTKHLEINNQSMFTKFNDCTV